MDSSAVVDDMRKEIAALKEMLRQFIRRAGPCQIDVARGGCVAHGYPGPCYVFRAITLLGEKPEDD